MSILEKLLEEVIDTSNDEKIKIICDQIWEEEKNKVDYNEVLDHMPTGPNVFLTLLVPSKYKGVRTYLSLEREAPGKYIMVVRNQKIPTVQLDGDMQPMGEVHHQTKRSKSVEINEHKAERVLRKFAEYLKFMKGI